MDLILDWVLTVAGRQPERGRSPGYRAAARPAGSWTGSTGSRGALLRRTPPSPPSWTGCVLRRPPPTMADSSVLHNPGMASVEVRGAGAEGFLQAQLTSDRGRRSLPAGLVLSAWCTPRGRVRNLFWLVRRPDGARFSLVAPAGEADGLVRELRKFVLRAKVEVERTGDAGGGSGRGRVRSIRLRPGRRRPCAGVCRRVRRPARAPSRPACRTASFSLGLEAPPAGASGDEWRRLEITAGIAWLTDETRESFIPQMLDLDRLGALSFEKGCFPGQEVIARTRYLGRLKRRLHRGRLPAGERPMPGDPVRIRRPERRHDRRRREECRGRRRLRAARDCRRRCRRRPAGVRGRTPHLALARGRVDAPRAAQSEAWNAMSRLGATGEPLPPPSRESRMAVPPGVVAARTALPDLVGRGRAPPRQAGPQARARRASGRRLPRPRLERSPLPLRRHADRWCSSTGWRAPANRPTPGGCSRRSGAAAGPRWSCTSGDAAASRTGSRGATTRGRPGISPGSPVRSQRASPDRPLFAAGVSLGGNVLLKWLGELGLGAPLAGAAAISVPFRSGAMRRSNRTRFLKSLQTTSGP